MMINEWANVTIHLCWLGRTRHPT